MPAITDLVTTIAQVLKKRHWKLVTAESCTGGGLAYALTAIPGSSAWFEQGWVTYSNRSKQELLGLSVSTLEKFGAVSAQTAAAMAEGAVINSGAEASIAITGIAGPDGGTPEKPVGMVWFAWKGANFATQAQVQYFNGDRTAIRQQAIQYALTGFVEKL
jgi:nicotinamide-nucleotide amidase